MVPLHVLFGLLGIGSGALALAIARGSRLHVRSGQVFVVTMLSMASSGLALALVHPNAMSRLNGIAATLTAYLVLTGFVTMRRRDRDTRSIDAAAAVFGFAVAATAIVLALARTQGPPAPAYLMFAASALLAAVGDVRKCLHGIAGRRRLARHLWRMGAALWIATASFFLGQGRVFPESVRHPLLLAAPVLLVLAAVAYRYLRVRFGRAPATLRAALGSAEADWPAARFNP